MLLLVASLILLALGLGFRWAGTKTPGEGGESAVRSAENQALSWLGAAQEPGGLWSASRWGGDGRYDVGLTGLGLLAYLGSVRGGERLPAAADKAVQALLERQGPEGLFGPEFFASPYNHGIATVALLEAWGVGSGGKAHLREPLGRALRWIRSQQSSSGGWGYLGGAAEPNTALTFWPLQALILARGVGFEGLSPSIERGFQWLASVSDRSGRIGYRRPGEFPEGAGVLLASAAFCDALAGGRPLVPEELRRLWQDRLRLAAASGPEPGPGYYGELLFVSAASAHGLAPRLREGKDALLVRQLRSGGQRGSWEPDDRWGPVGGRIYATAAAALALQADRRVARLRGWLN
ncbi:MAG: terpene cyclase/mutase family protein [Planctomycetes bacterium]|nr:terpene cyclase/mutase family protein [Planctomycetota bacterium]